MAHPDDDPIVSGHLDEGTVHAWLDRQLPADDAARVESHIAGCAACRAQVAEARGFIAASSRILTALDGVPARVVPARRRGVQLWHVRAAAAVLIVALGTATVLRNVGTPTVSRRVAIPSDSQRLESASALANENKPILPSPAPPPAAALSQKPVFREQARAPAVPKTPPRPAEKRDEIKGSGVRGQGSETADKARVPREENKERAAVSGVPGASPPMPLAASAGVAGGAVVQGVAPAAPAIAGRIASPAPGAASVQPRRLDAGASARNSVTATDSIAASRPSPTATAAPPAAQRDLAAKVADADRKKAQTPAGAASALGQSHLIVLSASACVGRTVTVASGVTDSDRQIVMATVQLEAAPSTDARYPGFALGTMVDSGPPAGAWTPLGPDSAILTLPVEGPGAVARAGPGRVDSAVADTLREQIVRRRVRCPPQ